MEDSDMVQLSLEVKSRDVLGKGVKSLRRQGIVPLHLIGHGLESLALQCEVAMVEKSLASAGETRLIYLTVDKERKPRPVLVREVQRDSLSRKLLHVDLYQVRMDEKVEVEVPIVLVGEAPALQVKDNSLLQELDSVSIESLPGRIPSSLKVDVSSLAEAGQVKRVQDIVVEPDIVITTNADQIVVAIVARPEEKAVETPAAVEAAPVPEKEPAGEAKEQA
jgi:large subunit ribosomal protein L25